MTAVRIVDETNYDIRHNGNPALHKPLRWYATEDDSMLGVVVLDLLNLDFGWVTMTQNERGPEYTASDAATSYPTVADATRALHAAMTAREAAS